MQAHGLGVVGGAVVVSGAVVVASVVGGTVVISFGRRRLISIISTLFAITYHMVLLQELELAELCRMDSNPKGTHNYKNNLFENG